MKMFNQPTNLEGIRHQPSCQYRDGPNPVRDYPCECYAEGAFNLGAVAAMENMVTLLSDQATLQSHEARQWKMKKNNRRATACSYGAQLLTNYSKGLQQLINKILHFK